MSIMTIPSIFLFDLFIQSLWQSPVLLYCEGKSVRKHFITFIVKQFASYFLFVVWYTAPVCMHKNTLVQLYITYGISRPHGDYLVCVHPRAEGCGKFLVSRICYNT